MLRWAVDGLSDFQDLANRFAENRENYSIDRKLNFDGTEITFNLRVTPIPDQLRRIATHTLWDVKHALDHATYTAVSAVLGSDPGDVHFPIGNHPNNFRTKVSGPKSKFPVQLRPTYESFQCYPTGSGYDGGNDIVCVFNRLANTSKHSVSLGMAAALGVQRAHGAGKIGGARLFPEGLLFVDNELPIGIFPYDPNLEIELDFNFVVCFGEDQTLLGQRAEMMLAVYGGYAKTFIDRLEADVSAILDE